MPSAPLLPYALATPAFPFRHLVAFAGRAPIGGAREVALACFVIARLADDVRVAGFEDAAVRANRCAAAKSWLGTLVLPAPVKASVGRCAESTVVATRAELASAVAAVAEAAAVYLDSASCQELETLARSLNA